MSLFDTVKDRVSARMAAELYGLKVDRHGMCRCPFHNDKRPSLKVDRRFHCFACQADGDVIDFVAKLRGVGKIKALKMLCADFGIDLTDNRKRQTEGILPYISENKRMEHIQSYWYEELSDYYKQLLDWRISFSPQKSDNSWNPRFSESLVNIPVVKNDIDILLLGPEADKKLVIDEYNRKRKELYRMDPIERIPVYYHDSEYASAHNETYKYQSSHQANIACKEDIDAEISRSFDGLHLKKDCVNKILSKYGAERVQLILAANVQQKHWDKRFSAGNRDWAFSVDLPDYGSSNNSCYLLKLVLSAHPAVLDGFISIFRDEMRTREMDFRPSIRKLLNQPVKAEDKIASLQELTSQKEVKKNVRQLSRE